MFDFSWIVTIASVTGTTANACKKCWGFVIWMLTNTFWVIYDVHFGLFPQAALYVVNFALAVTGFVLWGKKKTKKITCNNIHSCNEMVLPGGIILRAENYGDDPTWKSIDIVITYPDGISEVVCCADYDQEKKLLRALAFKQGDNDEPVFSLDYLRTERGAAV